LSDKQLWLLVGGNGAGKTSFYELFLKLKGLSFINADSIAQTLSPEAHKDVSYEAAVLAERMRQDMVDQGLSFCFETVYSHPSKIDFTAQAKALGYQVILVFIHLDDPELNLARISQRVSEGGHDVPEQKVRSRLPRTFNNVVQAIAIADEAHILDNSSWDEPFRRVAFIRDGEIQVLCDPAPIWVRELLGSEPTD